MSGAVCVGAKKRIWNVELGISPRDAYPPAPANGDAGDVLIDAHEAPLDAGGGVSFRESGSLRDQLEHCRRAQRG